MTHVRGPRVVQLLEDPAITGPLLHFAVTLSAAVDSGATVSMTWLGSHLWPVGGRDLVCDLIDHDLLGQGLLPRYFPELPWHQWQRPALRLIQGGAA
jgi:hypothetical protein